MLSSNNTGSGKALTNNSSNNNNLKCRSRIDSSRSIDGGSATATSWPNPSPRGSDDEDCCVDDLWQEEMLSQPPSPLSPKMHLAMSARPSTVPPINLDKAINLQAVRLNQARQKAKAKEDQHDAAAMSWTYLDLLTWASGGSQQAPQAQAKVLRGTSTGAAGSTAAGVAANAPSLEAKKWRTCEGVGGLCDEEEVTISTGPDSEIKLEHPSNTSEYHPSFFGTSFSNSWFG
mmetsp:Transcript_44484/g.95525  ORF Transcript_44484/g.95525 Transcript_44484/m.95525 type:complete len:231 (+) Transcript_44484:188-880(+)|eukprot:CAMPEP_0206456708 /NCGR_PEP_ID=MMETSP0324_2-20121206/22531_1 /ASSEMBLY_ACC=CAM_ASM_000836 /TAXON_ID=2866 /ORGANISM="Crypthecodinium cohnii, Strain Seligo" /LENGTH=230 /DNA_ID=CAMNT_0053927699 /DNA_START=100 /DNA_END=792 /DNA_ORIENTATION=+